MIEALRSWFEQNSSLLEEEGISGGLSPGSVGLLKNGISAELKTNHLEATIELWETGESDFHFLDWEATERDPEVGVVVTHYDFQGEQELWVALDKLVSRMIPTESEKSINLGRHLEIKGKKAEEFLYSLATKTFLTDWCYLNPKNSKGVELCDLLVVFNDTVIIWQVKDLKLDINGRYDNSEVEKNLRQLAGARRHMFDLQQPIFLENPRRVKEKFDPSAINHVYMISALLGEGEDFHRLFDEIKSHTVHLFTREATQIILSELDTISDFTEYLHKKEEALLDPNKQTRLIIQGGEEELLAMYLSNNRTFGLSDNSITMMFLDGDSWEALKNNPQYIAKKQEDKISYGWDDIINRAHTSEAPEYEIIARELARPNRFNRRVLGKTMLDAWQLAREDKQHDVFRRVASVDGVTYCFLFADQKISREERRAALSVFCFIARGKVPENAKVIGIASERELGETCSYDFMLIDMPEWTPKDQKDMEQLQAKTSQNWYFGKA